VISGVFKLLDGSLMQQLRFESITNNLSNINTNGFKKDVITFDMALSMNGTSRIDFSNGPIVHTGNNLDVALEGSGFFQVQTEGGIRYTRDGAFTLDSEGMLVTLNGEAILGESGPITVKGKTINISRDGQISDENGRIDTLAITDFQNPQMLKKVGNSKYDYTGNTEGIMAAENPNVQQFYLEKSNVNPSEEMIKMIEAFRNFESVQKAIQNMTEVTNKLINDIEL
jgi:flagellar basal-body rod protein FlgG